MEKRQNWILAVSVALFTVCLGFLKLQELPSWHISFGETSREDKLTTTFGQRLHQQQTEVNHIIENIRAQVGLHKWEDAEAVESVKDQPRHEAKGYKLEALRPLPGSMIRRDSPVEISVTVKRPPNSKASELREVKAVLKYGGTDNTVWEYDVPPLPSDNAETIILHKVDESKDAMTFRAMVNPGKTAGGFTTISYIAILDNQTCLEAVNTVYADDCDWSARKVGPLRDVLNAKLARQRKETSDWQLSRQKIGSRYTPLHPELRQFSSEYLVKDFWRQNITEVKGMPGVFFVPQVFSPKFLTLLNEELTHAISQNVNWTRPNTMNNFGFMLAELGFEDFFNDFVTKVLNPLRLRFLPEWGHLDSQHTFTIGYGVEEDKSLDRHMDLSEVTLNICLEKSDEYTGTKLYFDGQRGSEKPRVFVDHPRNSGLFHPGQYWHGAASTHDESAKTNRRNLIVWGRSSSYRSSPLEHYLRESASESRY